MNRRANKTGRSKGSLSDFVAIERYILRSAAWRSLSPVERAVYVEFAYHYNGTNNGLIRISTRMLADGLGIGKATACRCIKVLAERGFIV
jgi:DNA-binding MarR family transcriptional regulator